MKMPKPSPKKVADFLRAEAVRIEQAEDQINVLKEHHDFEERIYKIKRTKTPPPADARITGSADRAGYRAGGMDSGRNGSDRKVTGRGWELLCVACNGQAAKLIAKALNHYLKEKSPELFEQINHETHYTERNSEGVLEVKAYRKLKGKKK